MPHRFPRSHHLKRQRLVRPLFDRTATDTQTVSSGSVRIVYRIVSLDEAGPGHSVRAGFAVPRRTGTAVVRNRIKRIMRETWRLHALTSDPRTHQKLMDAGQVVTAMSIFRSTPDDIPRIPHDLGEAIGQLEPLMSTAHTDPKLRG